MVISAKRTSGPERFCLGRIDRIRQPVKLTACGKAETLCYCQAPSRRRKSTSSPKW